MDPVARGDALTANPLSQFAETTSLQLKGVISDETGSGKLVFATSPTLVTPLLGTPTSGVLTNCTGLPIAGGGTGKTTAMTAKDALTIQDTMASAATVDLSASLGEFIWITGTTTITDFGNGPNGAERVLEFQSILTITNNANIQLPGNADIVTNGNDRAIFRSLSGIWHCVVYQRFLSPPVSGTNTGDQTNVSGSSGSCTGNAATATVLATPRAINGVNFNGSAAIAVPGVIKVTTILAGTTTYTPDAACTKIFAEAWGGGGAGGGCPASSAAQITQGVGGGGGAYSAVWLTSAVVTAGAFTCIVGAGGTGSSNADGTAGADTTLTDFNSVVRLTAKGGAKGLQSQGMPTGTSVISCPVGGIGGLASSGVGDIKINGGDAFPPGVRFSGTTSYSGQGGGSPSGGMPVKGIVNVAGAGTAGNFPGGGGSGPQDVNAAGARAGGAGANGLLKITEYY